MPSLNKTITTSLIETLQRKVEPHKLYEAMRKMNEDLNRAYESLFDGPLPPVSGAQLDLTAVPKSKLPPTIVYNNQENTYNGFDQILLNAALRVLVDDGLILRLQAIDIDNGMIAHNFEFISGGYDGDGAGIRFTDTGANGDRIDFIKFISATLKVILRLTETGIITIGQVPSIVGAFIGEIVFDNDKWIRANNAAGTGTFSMIGVDPNDVIRLGEDAAPDGDGHVSIPNKNDTDLPSAAAKQDGTICIDKTNNRLVYYTSGNRYRISGTSF